MRFSPWLLSLLLCVNPAHARSHGGTGHHGHHGGYSTHAIHPHRSAAAKHAFRHDHPCPSTGRTSGRCPGYVVDHIRALKRGGPDAPYNMQWQTIDEAKAKDRWE